jgi:hypothetical protein
MPPFCFALVAADHCSQNIARAMCAATKFLLLRAARRSLCSLNARTARTGIFFKHEGRRASSTRRLAGGGCMYLLRWPVLLPHVYVGNASLSVALAAGR